ncbi:hypothetical protein [uncultured Bacteroides sp.]|nr:hypothetical protein [uncultured Bacteroides sp.]
MRSTYKWEEDWRRDGNLPIPFCPMGKPAGIGGVTARAAGFQGV